MKIGILTDIHEDVEKLRAAIEQLRAGQPDSIVTLGDTCDLYGAGSQAPAVAVLLRAAGAVGVWGNHDFGLCHEVAPQVRAAADPDLLAYMATFRPRLEIGGCHFSHVEPWLDPYSPADLWYFDGPPGTAEQAARSFAAVPHRVCFVGHFHRWLAVTDAGPVRWDGNVPLVLDPARRYLIAVAPVCLGSFVVFDTDCQTLTPYLTTGPLGEADR